MEMFPTIQGEGFHQGKAAFFIRLAGCDVGCSWCDVKESWDANDHPECALSEIISEAEKHLMDLAVITGGEPLMYNLDELCGELHSAGFRIHIETSGAHPLSGDFDWITLSPKKFKEARNEYFEVADELKVVVVNRSDLQWAEEMAQKMIKPGHKLYLQPEWSKMDKVMPMIVEYIKEHPKWQVSLQIHKFMNIP